MQRFIRVAFLATCLLFTADARKLTQDALSNSNGCLHTIPKCETGACATRNIMGVAKWVCLRCQGGYEAVVDASGQDNIIQCVCPRGSFEAATGGCTRCPLNQFCPGGDKVENPTSRGTNTTCGDNLVTRNTGARTQADCLAPAGFARTSPTSATACGRSEYAPAFNRLSKCLRCQSGLEEPLDSGLANGVRDTKRKVCKLPPDKFMSQGLVRVCPQGFFREEYVEFDAAVGTVCKPCNPGVTTAGAGAGLRTDCKVVLPGYGILPVENVTSASDIPALPATNTTANGLPTAALCELGYYSLNGYCARCPKQTVTVAKGAKSVEECVVPPGYFLPSGTANMAKCVNGTSGSFREGWVMHSDPRATACTSCGDGIFSEARDIDENPLAPNGTLVMATSSSCYIDAGYGMIAQGANLFVGKECPANTYGAAGKVWGWAAAPCKPCPRNMITDGVTKVSNMDVCVNDDGFGYASEGASRCAPGFYSAKGSKKPCQQCPAGRTTDDAQAKQRVSSDCYVKPGFGVVNSTSNGTDAFNPDTTGLSPEQQAALAVLECPLGYFSSGTGVRALKCQACPAGSTTQETGSDDATACNVCIAGYGKSPPSAACTLCPYGTYQPGGLTECQPCPTAAFYTPVDGLGATFNSAGTTTYPGAYGAESCVPRYSQLSPEAGQAYLAPGAAATAVLLPEVSLASATFDACVTSCPVDKVCLAQYDSKASKCARAELAPAASTAAGPQLVYKLPPSTLGSASSVAGKMMASGYYAHAVIPSTLLTNWEAAGSNLGADARTFVQAKVATAAVADVKECKKLCDNSNVCWGFVFNAGACNFRGGVDALSTRTFAALPDAATVQLANFRW